MIRFRAAVAVAVGAALLLLAGCTAAPSAPLDLADVVTDADAPDGMAWVASGAELTAGDDLDTLEHYWEDSAGSPAACLPLYLLAYGIQPSDAGSGDRTTEVGYFGSDGLDGSIQVNAREFASEQVATGFIQHALESANDCPGYEIGGEAVGPDGFTIARFEGGHGLSLDGGHVVTGITSRTAVVRAGRTIIIVDAFLHDVDDVLPGFDSGVVDRIARTILERVGVSGSS